MAEWVKLVMSLRRKQRNKDWGDVGCHIQRRRSILTSKMKIDGPGTTSTWMTIIPDDTISDVRRGRQRLERIERGQEVRVLAISVEAGYVHAVLQMVSNSVQRIIHHDDLIKTKRVCMQFSR